MDIKNATFSFDVSVTVPFQKSNMWYTKLKLLFQSLIIRKLREFISNITLWLSIKNGFKKWCFPKLHFHFKINKLKNIHKLLKTHFFPLLRLIKLIGKIQFLDLKNIYKLKGVSKNRG